jgi:cytochrome b subunit of formate dehydrogenase
MRFRLLCPNLPIMLLAFATAGSGQSAGQLPCQTCHADKAQTLKTSAHASLSCATCHVGITTFPHPTSIPLPKCSQCHVKQAGQWVHSVHGLAFARGNKAAPNCQVCHGDPHSLQRTNTWAFKKSIPQLCGACHVEPYDNYHASIHGQSLDRGVVQAPTCVSCHTAHSIQAPTVATSTVFPTHIPETCGQCHGSVRMARAFNIPPNRLLSYNASFHGLALKGGSLVAANCASCHGIHLILAASDPRSTINAKNLPKTCGKCHPDAGERFALTPVHVLPGAPGMGPPPAVRWIRVFYLIVIPLLIGLMFLHNIGDWIRKLADLRLRNIKRVRLPSATRPVDEPSGANGIRMYRLERWEHILLLISFVVLAWTGFAFHYSEAWWARPFSSTLWGWQLRGIIHRTAGVVFMAVAGIHIASLVKSRKFRLHWQLLWPRRKDVSEAIGTFAYNLGLRRERPTRSSHSYVEKAEYWAVIWGAVLMTITGVMLWAHNFVLAWLPMISLQIASTVHFYEALLAALAIMVWHFYSVIFDPEVYPMDPAWLTGHSVRQREGEPPEPEEQEKATKEKDEAAQLEAGSSAQSEEGKSG